MKRLIKLQEGAAAIIAAIIVAAVILSIALSTTLVALNDKDSLESFADAVRSFYAAEAGVGEALMQLRKEPSNLIFDDFTVGGLVVSSQFVEESCAGFSGCNSNIEATASTSKATRKVRYTCDNNIANCLWWELTP